MKNGAHAGFLGLALTTALSLGWAIAGEQDSEPLEGAEWEALARVTGFHSVKLRKSGFEARLLEADGASSMAQDPISLYLVVTNNGTSDLLEHAWRLRRGVARVRGVAPSSCGIDVKVEVDRIATNGEAAGRAPRLLHLCFLSAEGKLETKLKERETSR
jgi:hypothetical protein